MQKLLLVNSVLRKKSSVCQVYLNEAREKKKSWKWQVEQADHSTGFTVVLSFCIPQTFTLNGKMNSCVLSYQN